jgi:hypothetical protein
MFYKVKPPTEMTFEEFAEVFFGILSLPFEERDSVDAHEGFYFTGIYENIPIELYLEPDEDAMPFSIGLDTDNYDKRDLVEQEFRSKFIPKGYGFLRHVRQPDGETVWIGLH